MSFSSDVKEELAKHTGSARHCQIAELATLLLYCGKVKKDKNNQIQVVLETENSSVAQKGFTLLKKTFNIYTEITERTLGKQSKNAVYSIKLEKQDEVMKVLQAVKLMDGTGNLYWVNRTLTAVLIKNGCCQRAFLRGAYLAIGSMSDPEKSYHLELVCVSEEQAMQLRDVVIGFDIEAKIVQRKKYFVVYLKEGSGIVDFLNLTEAYVSLMNFENLRILKEMRNSINRRVNCEAANLTRTVTAASKQVEDIALIRDTCGLASLPDNLRKMAEVRLEYPDAPLKELGQYLQPPVGKSGVNHRLRKLSELAEKIKTSM